MSSLQTQALCLRVTPYSETSQVLRLLTPHGTRSVLAKGIKRPRNSFGGPADVLTLLDVDLRLRRNPDGLHTLVKARPSVWFSRFHTSLSAYYGAEYIREILLGLLTPDADAPDTFEISLRALAALNEGHSTVSVGARYAASMLRLHGLAPELYHCAITGNECKDNLFSYREFGLVSAAASQGLPDIVRIRPEVIALLRCIFERDKSDQGFRVDFWIQAFNVCSRLVELGLGRMLKVPPLLLNEFQREVLKEVNREAAMPKPLQEEQRA